MSDEEKSDAGDKTIRFKPTDEALDRLHQHERDIQKRAKEGADEKAASDVKAKTDDEARAAFQNAAADAAKPPEPPARRTSRSRQPTLSSTRTT